MNLEKKGTIENEEKLCKLCNIDLQKHYKFVKHLKGSIPLTRSLNLFELNYLNNYSKEIEQTLVHQQCEECIFCNDSFLKIKIEVMKLMSSICDTISKHNAKVIGGFVRDYLVPKLQFEET